MRDYLQKFNVENIKIELEKYQYTKDKIIYLIDIKTQSKQLPIDDKLHLGSGFLFLGLESWCDAEIQKLKELEQLELQYFDINKSHSESIKPTTESEKQIIDDNPEIKEVKTHFLFLAELGIIDHLKERYPNIQIIDTDYHLSKLIAQIMGYSDKKNIENIRTYIRDLRENDEFKNKTVANKIKGLMNFHHL